MGIEEDLIKELNKPLTFDKEKAHYKKNDVKIEQESDRDITKEEFYSKVIDFSQRIKKAYGDAIKSILIFGSAARGDMKKSSDVDLWIVIDDTATKNTEDINKIRLSIQLIAGELKTLHPQTTPLTEFWNWMRIGSPELFNFLRSGLVIYDTGFIKPVQRMLKMGLISPSQETSALKARSSEAILKRVEATMKTLVFDLRYAATDACQAVIMYFYHEAPDQKNMSAYLERLVKDKKLEKEYIKKFEDLNKLWKDIDHGIVKEAKIEHVEAAMKLSKEIVEKLKSLLPADIKEYDIGFGGLF
jgi:predicted nucleotidyltransferase